MYQKREQAGSNARDVVYKNVLLYAEQEVAGQPALLFPTGLRQRVEDILKRNDFAVTFVDMNPAALPEPAYDNLDLLREGQDEILARLIAFDYGVVEAPTGAGKSFVIRQICKLWPTARIIICTYAANIAREFYEELLLVFPAEQVGLCGDGKREHRCRITVCVSRSLLRAELDKCQIFLFDEVHRAASPQTAEMISHIRATKMFGFSATPYGRGDRADLETEAMFGPRIVEQTYQDIQQTGAIVPIEVHAFSTAACPPVSAFSTTALERQGLWRNDTRNRLIASAIETIKQEFGPDLQIMVAVETVDHAVHLRKYLANYQLAYRAIKADVLEKYKRWKLLPADYKALKPVEQLNLKHAFTNGTVREAIATGVWGTGVNFPGLNVVVRADAQSGSIATTQISGRVTRRSDGKSVGIIIDFLDEFNPTLERRAKDRLRIYRKKGWKIIEHKAATAYLNT